MHISFHAGVEEHYHPKHRLEPIIRSAEGHLFLKLNQLGEGELSLHVSEAQLYRIRKAIDDYFASNYGCIPVGILQKENGAEAELLRPASFAAAEKEPTQE